ncbi:ApeP family dehydratase [Pseudocitrobacter cyperus]|uniref:3-hydroxy-fatty acyl-ACP dehydratase n=1 Tax=Pseudocitrobacter cyperus TaxID=3112843 RepID=A0ABV0HJE9_9ENTR
MSHYSPPGDYLPHDAPLLLLDNVVTVSADDVQCQVAVDPTGVLAPFLDASGNLPGWYALELMAQTVGVWSGWHRQNKGVQQSTLGMVLGARELVCEAGDFPANATLDIQAHLLMQDSRFGSFECAILIDNVPAATGRVNTFQPTSEELTSLFNRGENA